MGNHYLDPVTCHGDLELLELLLKNESEQDLDNTIIITNPKAFKTTFGLWSSTYGWKMLGRVNIQTIIWTWCWIKNYRFISTQLWNSMLFKINGTPWSIFDILQLFLILSITNRNQTQYLDKNSGNLIPVLVSHLLWIKIAWTIQIYSW